MTPCRAGLSHMQIFLVSMPATNSSCPGLSRASTFFVPRERSWMAGTSPAMTMWKRLHESAPRSYAIALPSRRGGHLGSDYATSEPSRRSRVELALGIALGHFGRGQHLLDLAG